MNSYQELSDDEEDLYFDAHFENIKQELKITRPPLLHIPNGAKIRFLRISDYQIVSDIEKRKFCIFTLEVQCSLATPSKWKVYRRYSEFRKLSQILRREGYYVPVMPPKSVFHTISSDFLAKRSVSSFSIDFLIIFCRKISKHGYYILLSNILLIDQHLIHLTTNIFNIS